MVTGVSERSDVLQRSVGFGRGNGEGRHDLRCWPPVECRWHADADVTNGPSTEPAAAAVHYWVISESFNFQFALSPWKFADYRRIMRSTALFAALEWEKVVSSRETFFWITKRTARTSARRECEAFLMKGVSGCLWSRWRLGQDVAPLLSDVGTVCFK